MEERIEFTSFKICWAFSANWKRCN